ncbi:MAG: ABC transporter ATP-binding protein [Acidimicrobiia bacterium]
MTMMLNNLALAQADHGVRATQAAETDPRTVYPAASVVNGVKVYGTAGNTVRALDGVSVEFERGRFTAIMGPSGSGKSTLMHCVAGLDDLTSGSAYVGDTHLGSLDDRRLTRLRRDRIGFIFQAFNLLPTLTAVENITLPLALAGRRPDQDWLDRIIEVTGLRERLNHRPSQLSGGQQQRVAAARALVSKPEIIFADEPTGSLDSRAGADLLAFMRRAVDDFGQSIVMVTHDVKAAAVADRVVFLADGRIVDELSEPTTRRVLARMERLGE